MCLLRRPRCGLDPRPVASAAIHPESGPEDGALFAVIAAAVALPAPRSQSGERRGDDPLPVAHRAGADWPVSAVVTFIEPGVTVAVAGGALDLWRRDGRQGHHRRGRGHRGRRLRVEHPQHVPQHRPVLAAHVALRGGGALALRRGDDVGGGRVRAAGGDPDAAGGELADGDALLDRPGEGLLPTGSGGDSAGAVDRGDGCDAHGGVPLDCDPCGFLNPTKIL